MPFEQIMPALAKGEIDAGVIIHEGRFTYSQFGLNVLADLGAWWEQETGHPIPLGCIAARSSLKPGTIETIEHTIHASLMHARQHPGDSRGFIRSHAQEMDEQVIAQHIALYVNRFTEGYGSTGHAAIDCLLERAREARLF
jgi:1,4-dihydroxy-6-naphthoate synthase